MLLFQMPFKKFQYATVAFHIFQELSTPKIETPKKGFIGIKA